METSTLPSFGTWCWQLQALEEEVRLLPQYLHITCVITVLARQELLPDRGLKST